MSHFRNISVTYSILYQLNKMRRSEIQFAMCNVTMNLPNIMVYMLAHLLHIQKNLGLFISLEDSYPTFFLFPLRHKLGFYHKTGHNCFLHMLFNSAFTIMLLFDTTVYNQGSYKITINLVAL